MYVVYHHTESVFANPFTAMTRIGKFSTYQEAMTAWKTATTPFASILSDGRMIYTGSPSQ